MRSRTLLKDNDYEKGFDDFLKTGEVTKEQKQEFEQRKKDKEAAFKEAQDKAVEDRQKEDSRAEENFDKFLKGEKPTTITDDMTLQDIFKTYYKKAKTVDIKKAKILNSAASSLGSLSSRLEKRRKAAREAKESKESTKAEKSEASEKEEAKDDMKAEEPVAKSKKKEATQDPVDEAKDEAKAETPEGAEETAEEGAKETKKGKGKKKEVVEAKDGFFKKLGKKTEEINDNISAKYPKMGVGLSYFRDVWEETFPDPEKKMARRMEQRKKMAKMQRELEQKEKDLTPEEIEEIQANIPEWKRGAVTVTDGPTEKKKGIFGRMSSKVKSKISNTGAAQKFYESEDFQKLKDARANFTEFKNNLKDGIENT